MISAAKAAANAANAQLSTGPRTEEGKQRSSRNAMKHGLYSKTVVLDGESQQEFDAFFEQLKLEYNPRYASEVEMVRTVAETQWRLNRLRRFESVAMEIAIESHDLDCKFLLTYTLCEQRLTRTLQSTIKTLQSLQTPRDKAVRDQIESAVKIRQYALANKIEWKPADDGFDFPVEYLDRQIAYRGKLNQIKKAEKNADMQNFLAQTHGKIAA